MLIVFYGLTLTSSWGNGHAATYRGLLRGLHRRGHRVHFFERDREWYASNRDLPRPEYAQVHIYQQWQQARGEARALAAEADAVIVGSYFADAIPLLDDLLGTIAAPVGFYDIDTPITLEHLVAGDCAYLRADQIPALDFYLSFTGGPVLSELQNRWGAARVYPLYCGCDESAFHPGSGLTAAPGYALSYMGTYAPDRQSKFNRMMVEPARQMGGLRFRVAGPLFPETETWPSNLHYDYHLAPGDHARFYRSGRFTLNLTRQAMVEAGYSPSVRLFEAAFTGVPILTDPWPGVEEFFEPGAEILVATSGAEVIAAVREMSETEARRIGMAARERVRAHHSSGQRARELEGILARSILTGASPCAAPPALL